MNNETPVGFGLTEVGESHEYVVTKHYCVACGKGTAILTEGWCSYGCNYDGTDRTDGRLTESRTFKVVETLVRTERPAHLPPAEPKVQPDTQESYPCLNCGKPRTKAQGGEIFTVCDDCWHREPEEPAAPAEVTGE